MARKNRSECAQQRTTLAKVRFQRKKIVTIEPYSRTALVLDSAFFYRCRETQEIGRIIDARRRSPEGGHGHAGYGRIEPLALLHEDGWRDAPQASFRRHASRHPPRASGALPPDVCRTRSAAESLSICKDTFHLLCIRLGVVPRSWDWKLSPTP